MVAVKLYMKKTNEHHNKNKYLAKYCTEHFKVWFDKETFPADDYYYLMKYCPEHFNVWFDKETFPKKYYWYLTKYYPEHFNDWFDDDFRQKKVCLIDMIISKIFSLKSVCVVCVKKVDRVARQDAPLL